MTRDELIDLREIFVILFGNRSPNVGEIQRLNLIGKRHLIEQIVNWLIVYKRILNELEKEVTY